MERAAAGANVPRKGNRGMIVAKERPSLLGIIQLLIDDSCPPEAGMQLCCQITVDDGESCKRCWRRYAFYVANGRKTPAHRKHRNHQRNHRNHQRSH